jgi:pSer/pThr/pTyr-binding forkhead associated (FHA) protein
MSELALFLVRAGFLAVLWIFVFSIISVIRADLFGQKVVSRVAQANAPQVVSAPVAPTAPSSAATPLVMDANGSNATTLVIIEGERSGQKIALDRRELTIGRADNSDLVVDDEYASTNHAKLVLINNDWLIQDLNSTNGTYLDGGRVGTPAVVKLNTPVRVGKTVFELRA